MNALTLTLILAFLVLMLWLGPLLTITALNCLFGLQIVYNFKTWLAIVWLGLVFRSSSVASNIK